MRVCLASVATVVLLFGGSPAAAYDVSSDQSFLAGLRQRKLFLLAERYCTDRLADPRLADLDRAELVIQQSVLLVDWAVNSPPENRGPLWQRARQVTDDFAAAHPENPRLLPVRYQGALGLLTRGELARQEAEVVGDAKPLYEEAKTNLRAAIGVLGELDNLVEKELSRRSLPSSREALRADAGRLSDYQLASLKTDLQFQLARALRNQGQCYQRGSPDRVNSLSQSLRLLDSLVKLDTAHPLAWKSRLEEIVCYRLLEDHAGAEKRIARLLTENLPPSVRLQARAQRMRLALAAHRPSAEPPWTAIALLSEGRQIDGVTSADLDYAWLETFLEAWRVAEASGEALDAAKWQAAAINQVGLIERLHGPYWTRRAEMLLAGFVGSSPGGNLAMQIRAAESAYRGGRFLNAVAAYDRARSSAQEQGDAARAFQLGYTAAAILRKEDRPQEAMSRFRDLALTMPGQPKAPEAHLVAVDQAAQNALDRMPGALERYDKLLAEHLATWPDSNSADPIRWRLGRLREHQQNWPAAIAIYRAISPDFPRFDAVVDAAVGCYRAWLDGRKTEGEPTDKIATEAAAWFESLIYSADSEPPERWSPAAREAALAAARLWIDYVGEGFDAAQRVLSDALNGVDNPPPEWKSAALALQVLSLAGQGRRSEAAHTLEWISQGSTDQLLEILADLAELTEAADAEVRMELAGLQLRAVELLGRSRSQLTPEQQKALDQIGAKALASADRWDEARELYRRLSAAYPNDGEIQQSFAELLLTYTDRESLQAALAKWRELEKRSPEGSDRWFAAKYSVARLHLRLGNKRQAEKMIRLLQILHPDLGGPKMKAQFLDLLRECRQ